MSEGLINGAQLFRLGPLSESQKAEAEVSSEMNCSAHDVTSPTVQNRTDPDLTSSTPVRFHRYGTLGSGMGRFSRPVSLL